MSRLIENLESRRLFHSALSVSVNFAPLDARRAPGFQTEYGVTYGPRRGGRSYGFDIDSTANAVDRGIADVQKNDTFIAMQAGGNRTWSIGVENGAYDVYIVAGDPGAYNERMAFTVEDQVALSGITRKSKRYLEGLTNVVVTDGKLTVGNASTAVANKICYLAVIATEQSTANTLTVDTPTPLAKETGRVKGMFRVSRTGDVSQAVTVPITVGGTATNGTDYSRYGREITFAAGVSSIDLPVTPLTDSLTEGDETVALTLGAPAHYTLVEPTATVTIQDATPTTPTTPTDPSTPAAPATLSWTTKASRPLAASEVFGASVGNTVYTFGGFVDNTYKPTKAAYAYNVSTNTWTRKADLPVGLTHTGVAEDGTNIYFAGGYPGTGTNGNQQFATTAVYKYDTVADTYTAMPGLPAARGGGALAKVGNFLYFMGGTSGITDTSRTDVTTVYRLDLTNLSAGWVTRKSLPAARNHPAAVTINGSLYFLGGQTSQDASLTTQSSLYRYNGSTDTWTTLASLPGGRSHITDATFVYNNTIVVVAGQSAYETALASVLRYDPITNKWTTLASLPTARFSGVGQLTGGNKIVYTAGYNGGFKNNTYVGTLS